MTSARIAPEEVAGIGLSGQMHGLVAVDRAHRVLRPAIIWCDQRSAPQADEIRRVIGQERLGRLTQNPVSAGFQVCSLLWMRDNEPELFRRIDQALLPKDYLRLRLTGLSGTEPTDACSTLLFDCAAGDWCGKLFDALTLDRSLVPDALHLPTDVQGGLTAAAAAELGLREGTPVVFGGGDQPMQAIGNGILAPGDISVTLGTGGQIFVPVDRPVYDPQLRTHTFCHAGRNSWYVMGAILNCCLAQNWFFDKVLADHDFRALHEAPRRLPRGATD